MEFNDNSEFNPFVDFSKQKFPQTKPRFHANNNPFQLRRNDYLELNFNTTIKSKPRPKHYPHLDINPFENEGNVPFKKDKDKINPAFQGLNNNRNISNNKNSNDDDNNIVLRPNINIFICDSSFLNNNPLKIRGTHHQIKSNKKEKEKNDEKSIFNIKLKEKEKEKEKKFNLIVDIDNNMNAPAPIAPIDPMISFQEKFEKLKLDDENENPFKIKESINKEKDEKIYTNDGEGNLGDYYFD